MNYSEHNNKKRQRRYKSHGKKVKNKVGFIIFRILVATVLISGFGLSAAGIGAYLSIIQNGPSLSDLHFNLLEGSFDSIILDVNGNEMARLEGGVNRVFAEWDEISPYIKLAFVAIEDERFWEHNGVDAQSMVRALYQTLLHDNTQGASTITQQLIKNQLEIQFNTIESKLQEQHLAIQYEAWLVEELGSVEAAKERILHQYLNMVHLGHGQDGVAAAAWFFFNKDVSEITLSEAAVLAAITSNPWQRSPIRFPDWNRERAFDALDIMLRTGVITESQFRTARGEIASGEVYRRIQQASAAIQEESGVWSFFVDAVIDQLEADLTAMGMTLREAQTMIYHGGLIVETTMNPIVQDIVDETFLNESHFPTNVQDFEYFLTYRVTIQNTTTEAASHHERTSSHWGRRVTGRDMFDEFIEWAQGQILGMDDEIIADVFFAVPQPQSSMVILDHHTGHVLAMAGQRGEKQTNRDFNRATQSMRHPGSVFKIFASYAPAFDVGLITAATTYDDAPNIIFDWPTQSYISWPSNWYRHQPFPFRGFNSVRQSIADSINVNAVKNFNAMPAQLAYNYLLNFGFTTIGADEAGNPSMALGGLTHGVTNIELTGAMGAIANGGILNQPILYTRVTNVHGEVIIDNTALSPTQVMNRNASYILLDTMRDVIIRGTGTSARFQQLTTMDNAGKTGTAQEGRDLYYTGSTPHLTASVWIGHDQPRTLTTNVTGGNRPDTRIWRYIMERVHIALELPEIRFERPSGFVYAQICAVSGLLAIPGLCDHDPRGSQVHTELFAPGTVPTTFCNVHRAFYYEIDTGLLPSTWTPADRIERRVGIVRDRSWMEIAGNVPISDAHVEVPQAILAGQVSDFWGPFGPTGGFEGLPDYDDSDEGYWGDWGWIWGNNDNNDDEPGEQDEQEPGDIFMDDYDDEDNTQAQSQNHTLPAAASLGSAATQTGGTQTANTLVTPTPTPAPTPTQALEPPLPTPTPMPQRTPIAMPEATAVPQPAQAPQPTPTPNAGPAIGTPGS